MKSSRISRIVRLLTVLQSERHYSVAELVELMTVSRRTLFRDLNELAAIGVPYHFDNQAGGYAIDPEFFLPPVDLNLQEALSLLFLVHRDSRHLPPAFGRSAVLAGLKVENNLPPKIRKYCDATLRSITVKSDSQVPAESLDRVFSQLQKAVNRKFKVAMEYHSLFDAKNVTITLCPYHLMYNRRAWYVIGFSSEHDSVRTFKLNRIRSLELLDRRFIDGESFDIENYFGKAWSMIPEGKIHRVKLHFTPKVATNVAEVKWHETQQVTRQTDGSAIVQFTVDGLNEIGWWILGYGDQVKVLAPAKLRKHIAAVAGRMAKLNE